MLYMYRNLPYKQESHVRFGARTTSATTTTAACSNAKSASSWMREAHDEYAPGLGWCIPLMDGRFIDEMRPEAQKPDQ